MRICFDLDGVICTGYPYSEAIRIDGVSEYMHELKAAGHTIIIHTARGMNTYSGNTGKVIAAFASLTINQLKEWNIPYDELVFGKPSYDIVIDDKSFNSLIHLKGEMGINYVNREQQYYDLSTH